MPLTVRFAAFHRPNSRVILINASDAQETCSHVSSLSFDTLSYLRRAGLIEGTSTESGADVFGPPHVVRKAIGRKANRLRWCRIILLRKCYVAAARVGLSFFLDGEPEISEHSYGASFSALEVTGTKPPARSELESYAQDCLRGVAAFVPDQLIRRRRGKTVLGVEPLRPQAVVLVDRAQHVVAVDAVPIPCFHPTLRPFVAWDLGRFMGSDLIGIRRLYRALSLQIRAAYRSMDRRQPAKAKRKYLSVRNERETFPAAVIDVILLSFVTV
jgi:hypothetical protein